MLVITREVNQELLVGPDVVIKILDVTHNRVRMGINAPDDVLIMRKEVMDRDSRATREVRFTTGWDNSGRINHACNKCGKVVYGNREMFKHVGECNASHKKTDTDVDPDQQV